MNAGMHDDVKRLLDGEITLADLPSELQAEGAAALRLVAAVDRTPVTFGADFDARVMARVRQHAASPARRAWRWVTEPRDTHVRVRPWILMPALAAAAALILLLARPAAQQPIVSTAALPESVPVQFVLYAPTAHHVAVAGSFNQWDAAATPLVRSDGSGLWIVTLTLPVGQHQYTFVVDGTRWVPDPQAPVVDDGFGRRNSVVAVATPGARIL